MELIFVSSKRILFSLNLKFSEDFHHFFKFKRSFMHNLFLLICILTFIFFNILMIYFILKSKKYKCVLSFVLKMNNQLYKRHDWIYSS